jgi:hypothetical protein
MHNFVSFYSVGSIGRFDRLERTHSGRIARIEAKGWEGTADGSQNYIFTKDIHK